MKLRKFVDRVTVHVASGKGGNGCVSFRREKYIPKGGPNGGDGGRGGSVFLVADRDEDSLLSLYFNPHQRAPSGGHGSGRDMHGANGSDLFVKVPCGTEAWDPEAGERLGDLVEHGDRLLVAQGGKGGIGNIHFKSSTHQTPYEHTDGVEGVTKTLRLELKLIADVGLVGLPNAGKSSLLCAISHAHPKIAAYPFTTLNPVIGTVDLDEYASIRVADIPGLIEGAHAGAGLGDAFLRHVERSSVLAMVIDMAGYEGRNPVDDYRTLRNELKLYKKELAQRACIVVANKMDIPEAAANLKEFRRRTKKKAIPVSAVMGTGLDELKSAMRELLAKPEPQPASPPADPAAPAAAQPAS